MWVSKSPLVHNKREEDDDEKFTMIRGFVCASTNKRPPSLLVLFLLVTSSHCVLAWFPQSTRDRTILDADWKTRGDSKSLRQRRQRQSTRRHRTSINQWRERIRQPPRGGGGGGVDEREESLLWDKATPTSVWAAATTTTTTRYDPQIDGTIENTATDATAVLATDMGTFF